MSGERQAMVDCEPRIVAHHVGGRGFGVAFVCPPQLDKDVVHILYEADEACARQMMAENTRPNLHILPYCLGAHDGHGDFFVTKDRYASSNLRPDPDYASYCSEMLLSGEVEGVCVEGLRYDAVLGNEHRIEEVRHVALRSLDSLMRKDRAVEGLAPDFLSLDTQGSELNILKGGEETFRQHCLALATEIEFYPFYRDQALFSDIFDFVLRRGFHFAGFTHLQEISSKRFPAGMRAKGFLGFGDAVFLRRIDGVEQIAPSRNDRYIKLIKLAFIALNFGYLEYAFEVLEAADRATPDADFRSRLMQRDCFRLLYELQSAAKTGPSVMLHDDRAELIAERRQILEREQSAGDPAPQPTVRADPAPGARIRHLVYRNPRAAIAKLHRHFQIRRMQVWEAERQRDPSSFSLPITPVEEVLARHGYGWLAHLVRQRRQAAEPSIPGQMR